MAYPGQYQDPAAGVAACLEVVCVGCGKRTQMHVNIITGRPIQIEGCACGHSTFSITYTVRQ